MGGIIRSSIHGRFQPFHNGHLSYALQAFERSDFVYVGLTQVLRPSDDRNAEKSRDAASSNPLTYYERALIIDRALRAEGLSCDRYAICPFPIEKPDTLPQFVPVDVVAFTTRLNEWNDEKIARLQCVGYAVEVLSAADTGTLTAVTTGTRIREMIRKRDDEWRRFVPAAVSREIERRFIHSF